MIEALTPESIAAEIKLLRDDANYRGSILLVEGETDANFFASLFANNNVLIRWMKGKSNTLRLAQILDDDNCDGFVAIVDADFWYLDGVPQLGSNVFITDLHDLDIMIFSSPAFQKVIREYFSTSALERLERVFGDLKVALLNSVKQIGYFRWVNDKQRLGIRFRNVSDQSDVMHWVELFIVTELRFEVDAVLVSLCRTNSRLRRRLKAELEHDDINSYDALILCNGHDVMQATCKLINTNGRQIVRDRVDVKDVERSFRLAYEMQFFKRTNLYNSLVQWQNATGYKFFE